MNKHCLNRQRGFTLLEAMVVISILAIIATIGVPSFVELVNRNRAASSANELLISLQLARSESVKSSAMVTVCPSTGTTCTAGATSWEGGWIVLRDNDVLRVFPALHPSVTLTGVSQVDYISTGSLLTGINPFELEVSTGSGQQRCISIELSGRAQIAPGSCAS